MVDEQTFNYGNDTVMRMTMLLELVRKIVMKTTTTNYVLYVNVNEATVKTGNK